MKAHPPEVVERVRELRILGGYVPAIAKVCGVSECFVWQTVRDLSKPPHRNALPAEKIEKLREMYFCGVPIKAMETLLDLSKSTIFSHVQDMPRRAGLSKVLVEQIRRRRARGESIAEISRELGVSKQAVRRHAAGVEVPPKLLKGDFARKVDAMRKLHAAGMSANAIAATLRTCRKTVRKYVRPPAPILPPEPKTCVPPDSTHP